MPDLSGDQGLVSLTPLLNPSYIYSSGKEGEVEAGKKEKHEGKSERATDK